MAPWVLLSALPIVASFHYPRRSPAALYSSRYEDRYADRYADDGIPPWAQQLVQAKKPAEPKADLRAGREEHAAKPERGPAPKRDPVAEMVAQAGSSVPPKGLTDAEEVRRTAEAAAQQASFEEQAARRAIEENMKAQEETTAKMAKVKGRLDEADEEVKQWRERMRDSIQSALLEKKAAAEAAKDRAHAEKELAKSVEAIPLIDEMAKEETTKAKSQLEDATQVMNEASKRKTLANRIATKANNEAKYYKELANSLAKQRDAAEAAAGGIEAVRRARTAKEMAVTKSIQGRDYAAPAAKAENVLDELDDLASEFGPDAPPVGAMDPEGIVSLHYKPAMPDLDLRGMVATDLTGRGRTVTGREGGQEDGGAQEGASAGQRLVRAKSTLSGVSPQTRRRVHAAPEEGADGAEQDAPKSEKRKRKAKKGETVQ